MSLTSGTNLGSYEIVEKIGAGGMGEVYRARDTKLDRDVALKVLPDDLAKDPDRLARFRREAKLLAALNHPRIAAIYGLEEHEETTFLVLELVEGGDLSARTPRALPIEEALAIARQIADALEEAHDKGIVHRDLKPENIKRTPDDQIKVLDFGLAKAYTGDSGEGEATDLSVSPTMTRATAAGMILGTAGYMSPEQARGKPVDKRSDIWAFGVVLYEMLTGCTLFEGATVSDVLAAVLRAEIDWSRLPAETPASIRRLLRRCLARDPRERLQHIGDARLEIDEAGAEPEAVMAPLRPFPWIVMAVVTLLALAFGGLVTRLASKPEPEPVRRFSIELTSADMRTGFQNISPVMALSPDGRSLVYRRRSEDETRLFLRPIDRLETTPIPGTEDALQPFFSPDSAWLAFFAGDQLKKVRVAGGVPVTLCDVDTPAGGSWRVPDTIVFAQRAGIYQVSAAGGTPKKLPVGDNLPPGGLDWPDVVPGSGAVLITAANTVSVVPPGGGEPRALTAGLGARYVPTGRILFYRGGTLFAAPFDPTRLELRGEAIPVVEDVSSTYFGALFVPHFMVADDGTLAYVAERPGASNRSLVWVDRDGRETPFPVEAREYVAPRISPNGQRVVTAITDRAGQREIWTIELERNTLTRLTFGEVTSTDPVWSPDGTRIAFASNRTGVHNIFIQSSSGISEPVQWTNLETGATFPRAWTPDGGALLFDRLGPGYFSIGTVTLGDEKSMSTPETPFLEAQPSLSPGGRFVAYMSDESGENEIYVRAHPETARKWQISTNGGTEPVWSPKGDEIFYRERDKVMSVEIATEPEIRFRSPIVLFEGDYAIDPFGGDARNYDISPYGQRFLMVKGGDSDSNQHVNIVLNWTQELEGN